MKIQPSNANVSVAFGTLPVANGGTGATTAQGAAQSLSVPFKLAEWGVPVGVAPTGTMGNNGAVTLGTALRKTYSNGIWLFFPAGAVAAGVPASASFLWVVMSSGTAGTVYNSTYTTGVPTVGVTTAFSTTGPGAFTGVTATEQGVIIAVPANSLGTNGQIQVKTLGSVNNTAGTKTFRVRHTGAAGTIYSSTTATNLVGIAQTVTIWNTGMTGAQVGTGYCVVSSNSVTMTTAQDGTADTSVGTDARITLQLGTATDYAVLEGGSVWVTSQ